MRVEVALTHGGRYEIVCIANGGQCDHFHAQPFPLSQGHPPESQLLRRLLEEYRGRVSSKAHRKPQSSERDDWA